MKLNTIQRKKARGAFEQAFGKEDLVNRMYEHIQNMAKMNSENGRGG